MAAWTRVEDAYTITFTRADNNARYIVHKDGHWHAETFMPFSEDGQGRTTSTAIADWYGRALVANGDTVS